MPTQQFGKQTVIVYHANGLDALSAATGKTVLGVYASYSERSVKAAD